MWVSGIPLAYFDALYLILVARFGAGDLRFEGNLVGWIDRHILPSVCARKPMMKMD